MPATAAEKTERATSKKREDSRKKGTVVKSTEVNTAVILLTGTLALSFTASYFVGNIRFFMTDVFTHATEFEITATNIQGYSYNGILLLLKTVGPILLSIFLLGITANVMQVGFMVSGQALKFELKKISPLSGFKRMFSAKSVADLVKSIIKIIVVGFLIFSAIKSASEDFIPLMDQNVAYIFAFIGMTMLKISLRASMGIVALAAFDYAFQKWEYEKSLRMTKQEVKEEIKEQEGDPIMKARIRSIQREASRKRMMTEVPKADVVITNPIHYAVALKYKSEEAEAPIVIAKGARKIALKIKEIAKEHGVPIVENPKLAKTIYKMCDLGMQIPLDLYRSVAEILAYVYGLKQKAN